MDRLPLSSAMEILSLQRFSLLLQWKEGRGICVLGTQDAVGSLTCPFLSCILQPESTSSSQGMESVGVGSTMGNTMNWGNNRLVHLLVLSWDNNRWVYLLALRAKRGVCGDNIGCFNIYPYWEQSSLDMFLYSVDVLGLLTWANVI